MATYVTFFSVGKDSETLIIDELMRVDEIIIWESKDQYFSARQTEPRPIDGGVFTYGLAAGTSGFPDLTWGSQIVSYLAPPSLLELLNQLDSLVHSMRQADWPEWEGA